MQYTGVYWMGHVYDKGGYGNASRNYLRALEAAGIPVFIHAIGSVDYEIGQETIHWINRLSTPHIGNKAIFICHSLPETFNEFHKIPNIVKKIGVTIFETDRIPAHWTPLCNQMDEIWIPSQFNFNTYSSCGVTPSKLKIVPYAIDTTKFHPGRTVQPIPFPPTVRSFKFLYVFAFDYRKGYDMLIQAFCEEFSPFEDASLIIKVYVYGYDQASHALEEVLSYVPEERYNQQIFIIVDSFDDEQMLQLYMSSDIYISMDRACGWGMPIMEMMALGKPVIAIHWGGSTEYVHAHNSFLIPPEPYLVPVNDKLQQKRPHYYKDHQWAEIDINTVKRVIREAYMNPLLRAQLGYQAAIDIHSKFSPQAIGERIKQLLGTLVL